jgi:ribosomal protein L33
MAGKAKARCVQPANILILTHEATLSIIFFFFGKSTLIVRLISTAQTGFFYTTQRLRTGPKLAAVKYDPRGTSVCRPVHFVVPVLSFPSLPPSLSVPTVPLHCVPL